MKRNYEISFVLTNDSIIVRIINKNSKIYESSIEINSLKNNELFKSMNITEIIQYLYFCILNEDCRIILYNSYLRLKVKPISPLSDFFDSLKKNPGKFKIGEYITKKILTYDDKTNEDFFKSKKKNEIEFNCKIKDTTTDKIKSLYEFFSCIVCKKILEDAYSCSCPKFICYKCLKNYSNKDCIFQKDDQINNIVSEIFKDQKINKNIINLYILNHISLKDLYLKKELKKLIIPEYKQLSLRESLYLINNLTSEEIIQNFKNIENELTPCNILDLISTVGSLVNNYINEIRNKSDKHFISISKALHSTKGSALFISGIVAKFLQDQGINVAIEEKSSSKTLSKSLMDWLLIGLLKFKKIVLHLDYGETINKEILEEETKKKEILEKWKKKIHEKIPNISLFPISVKEGSIMLSFATPDEFDILNLESLKNEKEVRDIKFKMLLEGCLISLDRFDTRWNNSGNGWANRGERRGGEIYDPPRDYFGYGLNVSKQYDNGMDTWLGMKNVKGEWWVAYHGAGRNTQDQKIKEIINSIVENGFIAGRNQVHSRRRNINPKSNEEYQQVGIGVYLSNKISVAESYAGIVRDDEQNEYKIVFMCRVCPEKVRISEAQADYYVADPNNNCIRPYRILLKIRN